MRSRRDAPSRLLAFTSLPLHPTSPPFPLPYHFAITYPLPLTPLPPLSQSLSRYPHAAPLLPTPSSTPTTNTTPPTPPLSHHRYLTAPHSPTALSLCYHSPHSSPTPPLPPHHPQPLTPLPPLLSPSSLLPAMPAWSPTARTWSTSWPLLW